MYTKGEWKVDREPPNPLNNHHSNYWIMGGADGLSVVAKFASVPSEDTKANARLISAAPDLLEALQKARAWMEDKREIAEIIDEIIIADEAITKATLKPKGENNDTKK